MNFLSTQLSIIVSNKRGVFFFAILNFFAILGATKLIAQETSPQFIQGNDTLVVYTDVPTLAHSDKYTIKVKSASTNNVWIDVFAHYTYNRAKELGGVSVPMNNGETLNTTVYHYAKHTSDWSHTYGNIEMSENSPVEVEIAMINGFKVRNLDLLKATVHPAQKASAATISDGKIYFTINKPCQVVIDINGQMDDFNAAIAGGIGMPVHAISLFANPVIKKPTLTNSRTYYVEPGTTFTDLRDSAANTASYDTIYYKPGVHDLDRDIKLYPGKVVYIPGDALVYGAMNNHNVPNDGFITNGTNIRIYGYGTLSGAKLVHYSYIPPSPSGHGIALENALNYGCHGISVIDAAEHATSTITGKNGVYSYMKVISWRANGDGLGSFETTTDCFIRTQDDASYVKGYKARCTFWKDANAALFHMPNIPENQSVPLIIEDCDVLYLRNRFPVGTGGGFQQRGEGVSGQRNVNVIFRNIRIHDSLVNAAVFNLQSYDGTEAAPTKVGSSYKGILFQNISIAGMAPNNKQRIFGCAEAPWYGGLVFDNLTIGGTKVTLANHLTYFNTNIFVKYLLFEMPKNVTLTTVADPNKGIVSRNPEQATYLETSTVELSAVGKSGYVFSNWSGALTGTTNPINVVVDKNMTITANFADPDFSKPLVISAPGTGSFTIPAGVISVTASIWGAGGAGGSASNAATAMQARGGGGAGGGFATITTPLTAGQVLSYTLGAGGVAAPVGFINNTSVAVQHGGNTSVLLDTTEIALAQGGQGGINIAGGTSTIAAGGAGGTAPTSGNKGNTAYYGGNGAAANANGTGGGGGSAGESGNGGNAVAGIDSIGLAGAGGGANGGKGINESNVGNAGGVPGAGGSGAAVRAVANSTMKGGSGADGFLVLTFLKTPLFSQPLTSYCYGETLTPLPTTSNNGITGTWSPALNNLATTTYTFTPTAGQYATTTTLTINIGGLTTWNGTSWSNDVPNSSTKAIIAGNYSQAANVTACSLDITGSTSVTVPSGFNFTISGKVAVAPTASFTLENNTNLIQLGANQNEGNTTITRNSAPLMRLDYSLWSSPVTNASQFLTTFSPLTLTNRFYNYNASTNVYNEVVSPSNTPFNLGTGYLIRMPNTHPATPLVWTGSFVGVPNNGTINITVSNNTYNAIGNPYPSSISANAFIDANVLTEPLYFWRKTNNALFSTYATYTKAGGTANSGGLSSIIPNGTIQIGQGFIAKSNSSSLVFDNTMRIANNDNQFLKTKEIERHRIWLNLSKETEPVNQMMVAYMTGASAGIDSGIDGKFFGDSPVALNSIIDNQEFVIQAKGLPFEDTDIIPLSFKTITEGNYSISIDHEDGLFSGNQDIFLKDNALGIIHNLKEQAYSFTASTGTFSTRFEIVYQSTLGITNPNFDTNNVYVFVKNKNINIKSGTTNMKNIQVFDIRGRLVFEKKEVNATQFEIENLKVEQAVLLVKITSQEGKIVSKKVIYDAKF